MPSSWFKLGAAGLIALFELGVLVVAFQPRVPAEYRSYFIEKRTSCFIMDRDIEPFPLGTDVSFVDGEAWDHCPTLYTGWRSSGEGWVKTKFGVGTAELRLKARGSSITIEARNLQKSDQPVIVLANGHMIGRLTFPTTQLNLPLLDAEDLIIRLQRSDAEALKVGLVSVRLDAAAP